MYLVTPGQRARPVGSSYIPSLVSECDNYPSVPTMYLVTPSQRSRSVGSSREEELSLVARMHQRNGNKLKTEGRARDRGRQLTLYQLMTANCYHGLP